MSKAKWSQEITNLETRMTAIKARLNYGGAIDDFERQTLRRVLKDVEAKWHLLIKMGPS